VNLLKLHYCLVVVFCRCLLGVRSKEGEKAGKVSMQVEVAVRRLC
jgi:hypothetical protein